MSVFNEMERKVFAVLIAERREIISGETSKYRTLVDDIISLQPKVFSVENMQSIADKLNLTIEIDPNSPNEGRHINLMLGLIKSDVMLKQVMDAKTYEELDKLISTFTGTN